MQVKTAFRLRFRAVDLVLTAAATAFGALMEARHRATHFHPAAAERDREFAVEALRHSDEIITVQVGASGLQP